MLRKLSAFILMTVAASAVAVAQQTPESDKKIEKIEKPFAFVFDGSGISYLGVQTQEINKENFAKYGLREVRGVAVEKVVENSPAAAAGLQNGDVIVKFNGEQVTGTRKLTRLISEVAPDHQATVTILRNGAEREITVTMGKRELPQFQSSGMTFGDFEPMLPQIQALPRAPRMPNAPFPPMNDGGGFVWRSGENRQIGIGVTDLSKQLADYFGVPSGKGLLVESVRENSPAAKAGLKAGDVIVEVEGKEVKNSFELIRAINGKTEGEVTLTIVRDKNRQTIRVTPEVVKSGFTPMFEGVEG